MRLAERWGRVPLQRQLTLGVGTVVAAAMLLFVLQMTLRQRAALLERQQVVALGATRTLAVAAANGLVARDLAGLQELVDAQRGQSQLVFAMLLDRQGQVLAHTDATRIGQFVRDLPPLTQALRVQRNDTHLDVTGVAQLGERAVGYARIGLSSEEARAELAAITRNGALLAAVAALLAAGLAALLGRWFTRRLAAIQAAADAVNQGDELRRAEVGGGDEAALLAHAFNRMLDSLAASRAALVASKQRLHLALDAATMVSWRWDVAAEQVEWDDSPARLLGPAPSGGYPYFPDQVLPEDRAAFVEAFRSALRGGTGYGIEFRLRRTDGEVRWLGAHGRLQRDARGRAIYLQGVTQDVTERRLADERLADTERRWLLALEASGLGVWDWNLTTGRVFYSPRWKAMLGLQDAALGDHFGEWSDRVHPDDRVRCQAALDRHLAGETADYRCEHRLQAADGRWLWCLAQGMVVERDAQGRPLRMVGTHRDTSEHKALEAEILEHRDHLEDLVAARTAELDAARQEAERLARVKSEFLANMSHEIRTPLHAVLGLAQLGVRDHAGSAAGETFGRIHEAGDHLLAVINDVLDFSRLEAGKLAVEQQPFALAQSLHWVQRLLAGQAEHKGLGFSVALDPGLPGQVVGDARRLEQILLNLLGNAVKFTERGAVRLRVRRDGAAAGDTLCFEVSDSGVGIAAEPLARLFQPFEQADGSTTRRFGGSGLGLAISRSLARLMGGDIQVVSTPGQGSTFTLRLPLPAATATSATPSPSAEPAQGAAVASAGPAGQTAAMAGTAATNATDATDATAGAAAAVPPAAAAAPAPRRLAGLRLLAAEDLEVNRMILEALLTHEGAEVRFAEHGAQAVDLVTVVGAGAFDLVLMDIQMPVMDGYQATQRLRALAPNLPVIGLTAHALGEERARCEAVGMAAHVTKPIDLEALVATILAVTEHTPA